MYNVWSRGACAIEGAKEGTGSTTNPFQAPHICRTMSLAHQSILVVPEAPFNHLSTLYPLANTNTNSHHPKLISFHPNQRAYVPPNTNLPSIPTSQISQSNQPLGQRIPSLYKRLSDVELKAKIDKGLYFRCDAKFSQGHRSIYIQRERESTPSSCGL